MNVAAYSTRSRPCALPRVMTVPIALCLAISLASCAPAPVVQTACPAPPAVLMVPTPTPTLPDAPTWRELAIYTAQLQSAAAQCNTDKQQLRAWSKRSE